MVKGNGFEPMPTGTQPVMLTTNTNPRRLYDQGRSYTYHIHDFIRSGSIWPTDRFVVSPQRNPGVQAGSVWR